MGTVQADLLRAVGRQYWKLPTGRGRRMILKMNCSDAHVTSSDALVTSSFYLATSSNARSY